MMNDLSGRSRSYRRVLLGAMVLTLASGCATSPMVEEADTSITPTSTPTTSSAAPSAVGASADGHRADLTVQLETLPLGTLTAEEADGLLWMREEEKLAHDVYVALSAAWGARIFENISQAETVHTESVLALLDRYDIDDPAAGNPAGVFTNTAIQDLYDELTAQGAESLVAALRVGAFIEERDIMDLRERASDLADLALVYDNLERGSRNHLRAFIRNLDKQGETYVPTELPIESFDEIISTPTERGDGTTVASDQHDEGEEVSGSGRGYRGGRSG